MSENFTLKDGRMLELRPAQPADYEAIQAYSDQLGQETIFTYQYPGRPHKSKEDFERAVQKSWWMVAWDGDKVAGLISVFQREPDHPWVKHICRFGVHMLKTYYRQGLGQKFLNLMFDWAAKHQITRIEGSVHAENRGAIALYLKNGFMLEGVRRRATFINGKWYNEYYIGRIQD